MGKVAIVLLLGLCSSCGALKSLEHAAEDIKNVAAEFKTAKVAADTNQDGRTSLAEWMAYLGALLGGVGAVGAATARRRAHHVEAEVDQLYDATHEPLRDTRPTVISG